MMVATAIVKTALDAGARELLNQVACYALHRPANPASGGSTTTCLAVVDFDELYYTLAAVKSHGKPSEQPHAATLMEQVNKVSRDWAASGNALGIVPRWFPDVLCHLYTSQLHTRSQYVASCTCMTVSYPTMDVLATVRATAYSGCFRVFDTALLIIRRNATGFKETGSL